MARTKGTLGKKTLLSMGQEIVKPIKKEVGKRGRPRIEKSFNTVLPVTEHKVKTFELENYQTDMPKVEKIKDLKGNYCHMVSGQNYQDAVNQAQKIMLDLGYIIVNYFEQKTFNRSIIISYNKP